MTIFQVVAIGITVIFLGIGLYAIIRNYAIDSMGEMRYMLKCAKERRQITPEDRVDLIKFEDEEIKSLEEKIENFWGKNLANRHKSVFDVIPTPEEDPDGSRVRSILSGEKLI